jgi:hypothetical protein
MTKKETTKCFSIVERKCREAIVSARKGGYNNARQHYRYACATTRFFDDICGTFNERNRVASNGMRNRLLTTARELNEIRDGIATDIDIDKHFADAKPCEV